MTRSHNHEHIDCLGLGIMPLDLLYVVRGYPLAGSKIDGESLTIQGGGPVPNVMIGLRRLGHSTALIAAIGNDFMGQIGRSSLTKEAVDTRFLIEKKGNSDTATGFVEKGSGRRTLVLNRDIHVTARDLNTAKLPIPRLIHLDGRDIEASVKLARWGRKVGATISFDIGSMRNDVTAILPLVDHLVVAHDYAFGFTNTSKATTAIKKLQKFCPGTIVVTEGINGSTGCEEATVVTQPAYKVKSVDTTGAGDAYHTGYIYGLLHGFSLSERMKFGAAIAAIKCEKMGARAGLPSLRQVNIFLKRGPAPYA